MEEIKFQLIQKDKIDVIIPLLHELDDSIPIETLKTRVPKMIQNDYECVGIYHKDQLIGICGLWTLVKYYIGKHMEVDNVYIKPEFRSQGIGQKLEAWVCNYARQKKCEAIELNCYIHNEKGRNFWENHDHKPLGIHYQKKL